MADLKQQDLQLPNPGMPDQTGASRGIDTNRAFEKLFAGIGNTIEISSKMKDNEIQSNIRKDARANYDSLLGDSGLGTDTETPQGVTEGVEQLKLMQSAYDQGKITDTHFYGRMTAQLKALRAKYPGYEDIVDEAVQSVTGVRPANAYRDSLMKMINDEQQTAQSEENKWDTYVKQNEEYIAGVAPDYFQNPDKYDKNELRSLVATRKAKDQAYQSDNLEMQNLQAHDALDEEKASDIITNRFSGEVTNSIETLNRVLKLDKISASTLNGTTPSAEEMGALVTQFQQIKMQTRQKLLKQAASQISEDSNETYYSLGGGPEKVNKIIDEVMAQFDVIEQYLGAKDFNMASYHSKLIEYRGNRDLNTVMQNNDALRMGSAISKISPALGEKFFLENEAAQGTLSNLVPEVLSGVALGKDTLGDATTRMVNSRQSATDKSTGVRDSIDGVIRGITSGTGSPQERANLIKGAYDPASTKALFGLVKPSEYQRLFAKMYNPEVTKAIVAGGDKRLMDLYSHSAMDRLGAIPEIRAMAADFQEGVEYAKGMKVAYDEKQNRLVVTMDAPASVKNAAGTVATWQNNKTMQKMVAGKDALNTAFATLGPIIEAAGGNETEAIKAVIKNLAIDLDGAQKDSILWQLHELIGDKTITKGILGDGPTGIKGVPIEPPEGVGALSTGAEVDLATKGVEIGQTKTQDAPSFSDLAVKAKEVIKGKGSFGKAVDKFQGEFNKADDSTKPAYFAGDGQISTSNKRGYTPDIEHLRPNLKQGIVQLQEVWGEPIKVISGFRDKGRNARAGGAKKSQHLHGNAVDIDAQGWSKAKRIKFIKAARANGFTGIGIYQNAIHIDKGKRRAWGPDHYSTSIPWWAKEALN